MSNRYAPAQRRSLPAPRQSFTRTHPLFSTFCGMILGTLFGLLIFLAFRQSPQMASADTKAEAPRLDVPQQVIIKPKLPITQKSS